MDTLNLTTDDAFLREIKLSIPESFPAKADEIYQVITDINETHNLTRITSSDDFKIRHILDSISSAAFYPELLTDSLSILDLGCGGGFPSIPLAALNANLEITAMDSEGMKVRCVADAAKRLGLNNLKTLHARGREASLKAEYKGQFDIVSARAVATADKLIKEARNFLKPGGRILLYKTPDAIQKESKLTDREAKKFKFRQELSEIFTLPNDAGQRQFLILHLDK